MMDALRRIHAHYFERLAALDGLEGGAAQGSLHVRDSLLAVRRQVLSGLRLLFSHVIPIAEQAHPTRHFAWKLALELGASLATATADDVTHVVAACGGTDKVRWANSRPAVHAVSLEWLVSCGYLWRREEEANYPVRAALPPAEVQPSDQLPPPRVE